MQLRWQGAFLIFVRTDILFRVNAIRRWQYSAEASLVLKLKWLALKCDDCVLQQPLWLEEPNDPVKHLLRREVFIRQLKLIRLLRYQVLEVVRHEQELVNLLDHDAQQVLVRIVDKFIHDQFKKGKGREQGLLQLLHKVVPLD